MQDPNMLPPEEALVPKSRKKKPSNRKAPMLQQGHSMKGFQEVLPPPPTQSGKKSSKRVSKNEVAPPFQQPGSLPLDSLPDTLTSGDEYRALRRKYLLLEEESFGLGSELKEVEDEIKTLEEEKLLLLDELVVLEGLVDPSELQTRGQ